MKVKGKPKPEGKWYKQGIEIIPSQEFQIEELEDGTSVLTIAETYPDDTGEIVFEAHNPLGVSTTTTYLSVEGRHKLQPRIILFKPHFLELLLSRLLMSIFICSNHKLKLFSAQRLRINNKPNFPPFLSSTPSLSKLHKTLTSKAFLTLLQI